MGIRAQDEIIFSETESLVKRKCGYNREISKDSSARSAHIISGIDAVQCLRKILRRCQRAIPAAPVLDRVLRPFMGDWESETGKLGGVPVLKRENRS